MSTRAGIRLLSFAVVLGGGFLALTPRPAAAAMCGGSSQCGTCCYGDLRACCLENGCTGVCELQTSFCCPGGYQLTGCYAT